MSQHSAVWVAILFLSAGQPLASAQPPHAPSEPALIAVLRSDDAEADKAMACKQLAIHGSAAAIPALGPLLAHDRLASWARIALEAIPGPEADAALRHAAKTLSGRLQIGAINSLGVRQDATAVPQLAALLDDGNADVAAAAAAALGRIGTAEAGVQLAGSLAATQDSARRDAVAEACVECGERLHATGNRAEATALYDAVRVADVSEQRRAEAIRGSILARGAAGVALLVETLRSPTRRIANIGLITARELGRGDRPDPAIADPVDRALIAEVAAGRSGGEAADRAVLVIDVLAERNAARGNAAVQAALLEATAAGPKPVRLAAVAALGRTGTAAVVGSLLDIAKDPDAEFAVVAREAIAALPGSEVDGEIKRRLADGDSALLPVVLGVVADRRIPATKELLSLVTNRDAVVRAAAFKALGAVVALDDLGVLIDQAVKPDNPADAEVARTALKEAAVRMPDREACAEKVAAVMATASTDQKLVLLDILGDVGGGKALAAVGAAGRSQDNALADAATRILGKWMTADAAPVLLELARPETGCAFQSRALRGYLRIARQFTLADAERAEMCRRALALATDEVDQTAILDILTRYPNAATLKVAEEAGGVAGLAEKSRAAVAAIRRKLPPPASGK